MWFLTQQSTLFLSTGNENHLLLGLCLSNLLYLQQLECLFLKKKKINLIKSLSCSNPLVNPQRVKSKARNLIFNVLM